MSDKAKLSPALSSHTSQAGARPLHDASGSQPKVVPSAKALSSFDKSVAKAVGGKLKLKTSSTSNSGIQ